MDRTFVTQQQKTPVHQLGLELWRDHVVRDPRIRQRLLAVLLELVQKERGGDVINNNIFRSITQVMKITCLGSPVSAGDVVQGPWCQLLLYRPVCLYGCCMAAVRNLGLRHLTFVSLASMPSAIIASPLPPISTIIPFPSSHP